MLAIQACGLCVTLAYYFFDASRPVFEKFETWKQEGGLIFAAVATIISAGIIPELVKRAIRPANIKPPKLGELAHQFAMWAWLGILVEAFYRFLAHVFGHGTDALTLVKKVAVDQLLFSPLLSLPLIVTWFLLYESGYKLPVFLKTLRLRTIYARVFPLWATCLSFWPIMLAITFSLPQTLQFVLFLFGNAAFSILMIFIIRRQSA